MSRFYASIHGSRGVSTGQGTPNSGIQGHIRGWNIGAVAYASVDPETGRDRVTLYITGGSNDPSYKELVGTWTLDEKYELKKSS